MTTKYSFKTIILATAACGLLAASATTAAAGAWGASHPRREQVNDRLARQNVRITNQVKAGDLTHAQAHSLRQDDRQVRGEERLMASQDGGHITKTDHAALNQQLNGVSQDIPH